MDSHRKEEAKGNFDRYLDEGLLQKMDVRQDILDKFEQNATESLISAKHLFDEDISLLWTIVTSYYAMFYIASAYVYKRGYKAQHKIVHKVITDSLIVLCKKDLEKNLLEEYEEEKDKALSIAENLLDSLEYERSKRASFQYEMSIDMKKSRAKTSLDRGTKFVEVFRRLLQA
jgi:uncharacterized protein (UPF0332 family)